MGLVTVFCPLTTTGAGVTGVQTAGEARLVVDCSVKPAALVGQVKSTFAPAGLIVSCGRRTGNEMLNTVPPPKAPAVLAIPYSMFPDNIKPTGAAPPMLVGYGGGIMFGLAAKS